jgi:hypothetical protein
MKCPVKNSPEWIALQNQFGLDVTEQLYNINKQEIPSVKRAEIIFAEKQALENNTTPVYTVTNELVPSQEQKNTYDRIDALEINGVKRVFFGNKSEALYEHATHAETLNTDNVSNIKMVDGRVDGGVKGILYYYEVKNPTIKEGQRVPITKKEIKEYLTKKGQDLIAIGVKDGKIQYLNPIDTKRLIGLFAAEAFERLETLDGKENLIVAAQAVLNDKILQLQADGKSVSLYAHTNELFDNYQTFVKGIVTKLGKYQLLMDESIDDVDNAEETSDLGDFDREILESALFSKLDNQIKTFLSFVVYEQDGIQQVANEQNLYNSILKAATLIKKGTILEKLEMFASKGNPQVKALVEKIKSSVIVDGVISPKYERFWNKFTKTFEKTRLKEDKLIIVDSETGRRVFIKNSDEDMSITKQLSAASTYYVTVTNEQYKTPQGKDYIDSLRKEVDDAYKSKDVERQAAAVKEFFDAVGIPLSDFYIDSSFGLIDIVDSNKFTKIDQNVVDYIYKQIISDKNPFGTESRKESNLMKLKSVLGSNALFDESVLEDNYVDANNNRRWAYAEQSYISLIHDDLQTQEGRQRLLELEPYLQNNLFYLLSPEEQQQMFSEMEISLSGSVQLSSEQKTGQTTFKTIDEQGYLLQGLNLLSSFSKKKVGTNDVKFFKILPKQWEAKSTAYNANMPFNVTSINGQLVVVNSLFERTGREFALNSDGRREMLRNLIYELDRISNTQSQIESNTDLIDGYHTGKKQGLKLFSFAFLSPELKGRLEERAKNKEDKSTPDYKADLLKAGEEISNKMGADFSNFLQLLTDNKVVVENSNGVLTAPQINNAAIANFVERGNAANEGNVLDFLSHYFVNYTINAFRFNQMYVGDLSFRKNFTDVVKRGGGELAFGPSAYREGYENAKVAYIEEPQRWVYLDNNKAIGKTDEDIANEVALLEERANQIAQELGTDPKVAFETLLAEEGLKQVDNADGQAYMSVDRFINVQISLGNTSSDPDFHRGRNILEKIKLGIPITFEERNLLIKQELIPNSVKGVYFNRNVYHKLSYMVLTKEFTSMLKPSVQKQVDTLLKNSKGVYTEEIKSMYANESNWVALPGKSVVHNLRVKMQEGVDNVAIDEVLPKSASKIATRVQAKLEGNTYNFKQENTTDIDNKYWRLQVKNPAGKIEITQGSQLIQLIDSEQDPNTIVTYKGREITVQELRTEYQRNLSRVRDSKYAQAKTYLNSNGTVNKKLLDKLRRNISATNPDSDLLEFLEMINDRDPKYNLNLPHIREKFENMLIGHMLKRSLRQKLPGLKCAVISDHGYKIVRDRSGKVISSQMIKADPDKYIDDNGNLKEGFVEDRLRFSDRSGEVTGFTEVCIPAYLAEMYNLKAGDNLPPSLSEIFGIRIPTEDKRSMMKAKIVEVLPAHMGNSIMVPSERIVYSGEDYDIDSIFIYRKEVYTDDQGNIRAYGSATTPNDRFYEFMQYIKKQEEFIEAREELEEGDDFYNDEMKKLDDQEMEIIINEFGLESIDDLKNRISTLRGNLKAIDKELSESNSSVITQAKFEFIVKKVWDARLIGYNDALLRLQVIQQAKKDLHKYLNAKALDALNLPTNMLELAEREGREGVSFNNYETSNDLVETLFKLYDNPSVKDIINSANDLTEMNELADLFGTKEVAKTNGAMYESPFGTYNAWKSNKDGKDNIGPVAKSNLTIAALTRNNIEIGVNYGIEIDGFKDRFGVTIEDDIILAKNEKGELQIAGTKTRRKGESLANLLSAMADNAKNQHANKLNLTYDTVGMAAYFLGLGLGNTRTMLLMNQGIVKRFAVTLSERNSKLQGDRVFASDIIRDIKRELAKELKSQNIDIKDLDTSLTTEDLVDNYNNRSALLDYKVISQIEKAANATLAMIDLGNVLGLNKSIKEFSTVEIENVLNSYNRIKETEVFTNLNKLFDTDLNVESNIRKVQDAYRSVQPYLFKFSPNVNSTTNSIFGDTKLAVRRSKAALETKNNIRSYVATALINRYMNRQLSISSFNDIFYELAEQFPYLNTGKYGEVKNNILEQYNDLVARDPIMGINPFLSLLNFNFESGKVSIATNSFIERTPDITKLIRDGFEELRRKHPEFTNSLLNYLKNNTGFEFVGSSFIGLLPAREFLNQSTIIDILQDPTFNDYEGLLYDEEIAAAEKQGLSPKVMLDIVLSIDYLSQNPFSLLLTEDQVNANLSRYEYYEVPVAFIRFKGEKAFIVYSMPNGQQIERAVLASPFKSGHLPYSIKQDIKNNSATGQVNFVKNITEETIEPTPVRDVKFNNSGLGMFAKLGPNVNADIKFKDSAGIEFNNVQSFVYGQLVISKAKREELAKLSTAEAAKAFFNGLPQISKRYDFTKPSKQLQETINALYILGYSKMLNANPEVANRLKETGALKIEFTGQLSSNQEQNQLAVSRIEGAVAYNRELLQQGKVANQTKFVSYTLNRDNTTYNIEELDGLTFEYIDESKYSVKVNNTGSVTIVDGNLFNHINRAFEYEAKGAKDGSGKIQRLSRQGFAQAMSALTKISFETLFNNTKENFNNTPPTTQYQQTSSEGIIASEKTLRDLGARMSARIGIPVKFISDRSQQFKGKLEGDTAVVNLAYATLDTPIHEILGHPIIRAIKNNQETQNNLHSTNNGRFVLIKRDGSKIYFDTQQEAKDYIKSSNISTLYQNLLKELETGRGKEVLDRIKRDYNIKNVHPDIFNGKKITDEEYDNINAEEIIISESDYLDSKRVEKRVGNKVYRKSIGEDANKNSAEVYELDTYTLEEQQEEAIVELLGLYTAGKLNNVRDGKLISLLKRLLKEMKAFMRELLGQKEVEIDRLPDNMTLGDIADLLAYSNSKLILPGNEVVYTTPDNQQFKTYAEASKHIGDLAKSVEDIDLSNITIDDTLPKSFTIGDYYVSKQGDNYIIQDEEQNIIDTIDINKAKELYKESYEYQTNIIEVESGILSGRNIQSFIEKNKPFEQSKEIIEEWKKVNNIQYNPEEVYSRGQEFVSVVGAYSDFDVNLMMQNLLQHIEDNEKAGGQFAISAFTKPVDKTIGHLEGGGGKIKFKMYPQSKDILWAANRDVYSGSVWDASEKISKDKESELLGVSYTKYPALVNVNAVEPNLANIIDNLAHHHNELGITLTGNNFRLEYDEDIPYTTKKIIDSVNSILDQKYGTLVKPEIKQKEIGNKYIVKEESAYGDFKTIIFNTEQEALDYKKSMEQYDDVVVRISKQTGIQSTQTNETLKENIKSVEDRVLIDSKYDNINRLVYKYKREELEPVFNEEDGFWQLETVEKNSKGFGVDVDYFTIFRTKEKAEEFLDRNYKELSTLPEKKEYNSQALINSKIAKLKEVAKKYPRSLIRSEVVGEFRGFTKDESIFQRTFESKSDKKDDGKLPPCG